MSERQLVDRCLIAFFHMSAGGRPASPHSLTAPTELVAFGGVAPSLRGETPKVRDIRLAHTTAEAVPITELVACAQTIAIAAMRFCASETHAAT